MKNSLKIAALGAAALMLLASCSAKETADTKPEETTSLVEETGDASRAKAADFSGMIVGKVKSVVGNQVTLELGEIDKNAMPERPTGDMPKPEGDGSSDSKRPKGEMPEGFSVPEGFTPPEGFSMPEGMTRPEGMSRPDFSGGSSSDRSFGGMDIEVNYTGETAQYVIPAEVQVGTGDYTSLSEGMVIGITLDENNVVSAVRILSKGAK